MTIGELYGPAMEIKDQPEADAYFEKIVVEIMSHGPLRDEAEGIAKQNLGYYAGYYDSETRARVERLFSCAHPIFGSIGDNGQPTPEQAFAAGVKAASS